MIQQNYDNPTLEVKSLPGGIFRFKVYELAEEKISKLLNDSPVTAQEAQILCGVKRSTAYAWYKSGAIPFSALAMIAQLAAKRGYFALHEYMLPSGMTVKLTNPGNIDGSVRDDLARFMPHLGSVVSTFENGDYDKAKAEYTQAMLELEQMGKEINQKLGIQVPG